MDPKARWNALAKKHNLKPIRFLTPLRKNMVKARESQFCDFWEDLGRALSTRGEWAKGKQFPTFDAIVMQDKFYVRLVEGCYEDGGATEGAELVRKVDRNNVEYWGYK